MTYKKELLESLTKRTYVFMYTIMENDQFGNIVKDGVPMHLDEKELTFYADTRQKPNYEEKLSLDCLPKKLSERIVSAIREQSLKAVEEEGYDFDEDISIILEPVPVELELALNELLGKGNDEEDTDNNATNDIILTFTASGISMVLGREIKLTLDGESGKKTGTIVGMPFIEEEKRVTNKLLDTFTPEAIDQILSLDEFPTDGGFVLDGFNYTLTIERNGQQKVYDLDDTNVGTCPLTKLLAKEISR